MNGDGSKQRYVSTFRMHIKPPRASSAPGNGPGTIETRTQKSDQTDKCTDTGKGCRRDGERELIMLGVCVWAGKAQLVLINKPEHGDASWRTTKTDHNISALFSSWCKNRKWDHALQVCCFIRCSGCPRPGIRLLYWGPFTYMSAHTAHHI